MSHYNAIVLGAGISGLVTASELVKRGVTNILIIDEFERVGGNHVSVNIDGLTFDIGSYFFSDDSPFFDHFPELLNYYLPGDYSIAKIKQNGLVCKYPFDFKIELLKRNPIILIKGLFSLLYGRLFCDPIKNTGEFVNYWIGSFFAKELGLHSYLKRFYGISPFLIEGIFAQKRMKWVSNNANFTKYFKKLFISNKSQKSSQRQMVRPREGFNFLYSMAAKSLMKKKVTFQLGVKVKKITSTSGLQSLLIDQGEITTSLLISTIPLNKLNLMVGKLVNDKIESVNLITLFFSFQGVRGFEQNVLYNFSKTGLWKRLTMHSDFYGKVKGREYFSVEFIYRNSDLTEAEARSDFISFVNKFNIFNGDMKLMGSTVTPSVYPVYKEGATAAAEDLISDYEANGIYTYGRQGGFDYQPIAAHSTKVAETNINKIFS